MTKRCYISLVQKIINQKIKKMKKLLFSGTILVASKQLSKGAFNWLATYSFDSPKESNKVDVVAFDCESKTEITNKIKELISVAEKDGSDEQTFAALRAYGERLANIAYHKEIPQSLLSAIRRNFPLVTKENSIYISGVSGTID